MSEGENKWENTILGDHRLMKEVCSLKNGTFLSEDTVKELKRFLQDIEKFAEDEQSYGLRKIESGLESLPALWQNLLRDSINCLRYYDRREREVATHSDDDLTKVPVFGLNELREYFDEFSRFEKILYGADASYRDHIHHVLRVWLIGMHILRTNDNWKQVHFGVPFSVYRDKEEDRFVDDKDGKIERVRDISQSELFSMWTIMALTHDLGYPLQKTHDINVTVEKMLRLFGDINIQRFRFNFQPHHQTLNDHLLRVISSKVVVDGKDTDPFGEITKKEGKKLFEPTEIKGFSTSVQQKFLTKFAKSLEQYQHGIISCSILLKTLLYFIETDYDFGRQKRLEYEDARQFFIRREILRSVAAHTCSDVYHSNVKTLAFLLILCDDMQEWDRPTFSDLKEWRPTGQDVQVELQNAELSKGNFAYTVKYAKVEDEDIMKGYAIRTFRHLDKLLRCAVDVIQREAKFECRLMFGDGTNGWEFVYDFVSSPSSREQAKSTYHKPKQPDVEPLKIWGSAADAILSKNAK